MWQVWVNKDIDLSFEDFKKKSLKKPKPKTITDDEEQAIMKKAEDILNIQINEEGT